MNLISLPFGFKRVHTLANCTICWCPRRNAGVVWVHFMWSKQSYFMLLSVFNENEHAMFANNVKLKGSYECKVGS